MSTTSGVAIMPASSPKAIMWAGLIAGGYGHYGRVCGLRILWRDSAAHLCRASLAGCSDPRALEGGMATAALGLFCHFTIAFGAATVFFLLSRKLPFLTRQFVLAGVVYGIAVYFFMGRVVIPLSRVHRGPFSLKMMIIGVSHPYFLRRPADLDHGQTLLG